MFRGEIQGSIFNDRVPALIHQMLGSSSLTEALDEIANLKYSALACKSSCCAGSVQYMRIRDQTSATDTKNHALKERVSELDAQNRELVETLSKAQSRNQELNEDIVELEINLKTAESILHKNRVTLREAEISWDREYKSMEADLLWEIEETKRIAAEEILIVSKQLLFLKNENSDRARTSHSSTPQNPGGTIILNMEPGRSRILKLQGQQGKFLPDPSASLIQLPAMVDSTFDFSDLDFVDARSSDSKDVKLLLEHIASLKKEHQEALCGALRKHETLVTLGREEIQKEIGENIRLNVQLQEFAQLKKSFASQKESRLQELMQHALHRFQNMTLSMAWSKWKDEARKSNFMKQVVRRMMNITASKMFDAWHTAVQTSKLSKCSEHLKQKCNETEQLKSRVDNMVEEIAVKNELLRKLQEALLDTKAANGLMTLEEFDFAKRKAGALEKENSELRRHTSLLQNQVDDMLDQTAHKDTEQSLLRQKIVQLERESLDFRGQISLLKHNFVDATGQMDIKDQNILTLEERIQSQCLITAALESTAAQTRQKYDALEKEVALSAAHSSMLFKELQETRSKLSFSLEKVSELQEQHSGMIERVDGTAGSIQALWRERETDIEEITLKLGVQEQLNREMQMSSEKQEQRIQDIQLENVHLNALQLKQMMDEDGNRRTADLLLDANQALSELQLIYDEDMLEVHALSQVLQLQIFSLKQELSQTKNRLQQLNELGTNRSTR